MSEGAMAEATTTPNKKAKKKAKPALPAPPPRPDEGFLAWRTWAIVGVLMVGGVVAWKLVGTSYKHDIETICNSEKGSGLSTDKETSKLTAWIRDHLGTPEGNELYSSITEARVADRAKKLQDEADKAHVSPCPIVQSYQQLAATSEARADLQRLCSSLNFPKLLASDDAVRLTMVKDWINTQAKSPRTKELLDQLSQAPPGPERAKVLRDAAGKLDVYSCENAKSLEAPPPPEPTGEPVVRLYSSMQVVGGLREEDVTKALADVTPALVDCYKKGIERKPDLAGKITVKLQVDPDGKITRDEPGEGSALSDQQTMLCLAHVIRTMKFPANPGPLASILLPLELTHK
jgi:hypothetical protein